MPYTTADARRGLLDTVASAIERLGLGLAALGEAYEQLDEPTGERLERELFAPVQLAYGRGQRTYSDFARRYELAGRGFAPAAAPAPSVGAYGLIEDAAQAVADADAVIVELQDSLAPVEVGDAQLRDGLREIRELLAPLAHRARELMRTLGR